MASISLDCYLSNVMYVRRPLQFNKVSKIYNIQTHRFQHSQDYSCHVIWDRFLKYYQSIKSYITFPYKLIGVCFVPKKKKKKVKVFPFLMLKEAQITFNLIKTRLQPDIEKYGGLQHIPYCFILATDTMDSIRKRNSGLTKLLRNSALTSLEFTYHSCWQVIQVSCVLLVGWAHLLNMILKVSVACVHLPKFSFFFF